MEDIIKNINNLVPKVDAGYVRATLIKCVDPIVKDFLPKILNNILYLKKEVEKLKPAKDESKSPFDIQVLT